MFDQWWNTYSDFLLLVNKLDIKQLSFLPSDMNRNLASIQLVILLSFLSNIIRGTNADTENPNSSIVDSQALIHHEGKFRGRTVKIQCKTLE